MKNMNVRKITGVAVLLAIEIVFQVIGNLVAIGPISLNLSLIPIAIGAIIYGPIAGGVLGFANGFLTLFAQGSQFFMGYSAFWTIFCCVVKTTAAGVIAGLVYMLLQKKNKTVGAIVSSLLVPVINTGVFALCCFTCFLPLVSGMTSEGTSVASIVFITFIGVNFFFEFGITAVLSPAIVKIIKIVTRSDKHAL